MRESSFVILVLFQLCFRSSPTRRLRWSALSFLPTLSKCHSRRLWPHFWLHCNKFQMFQQTRKRKQIVKDTAASPNIMTQIQNTLTKATRLNLEFIEQEVGLLHKRVELLICQKESIIDVPCCD